MALDLDLLASIASGGLGQWVEDKDGKKFYVKSEDCIGCLKDLQRFFRNDDPEGRPAFFAVHQYNLARSDLVPLIVSYPAEYDVVYNALKVCAFLTMPSHCESGTHLELQAEHMQRVREAFLAQDAVATVVGLLADPLSRHPRMREEDRVMVQLVITFIRNLVAIPTLQPPPAVSRTSALDAARRIKQGLLERLLDDHVLELLLMFAQHTRERPFSDETPMLVETFLHLLKNLDPEELLDAEVALREEQEQQTQRAQQQAQQAQQGQPRQQGQLGSGGLRPPPRPSPGGLVQMPKSLVAHNRAVAQLGPSRHARSDAVFVRRHSDHNRNVVVRNNPNIEELPRLAEVANKKQALAQKREGLKTHPRLDPALLLRMRQFLEQFLLEGYGILMGQVFKEVQPGLGVSRLYEADFLHFVELATLSTRYIRIREERKLKRKQEQDVAGKKEAANESLEQKEVKGGEGEEVSPFTPISATMGWDTFYWGMKLWLTTIDYPKKYLDTRPRVEWDLQHASVPLLKEMLLTLDLARVVGTPADRRAADRLQRRLLHDDLKESGLLPVLSKLIKFYNFKYQPRSHAVDLVETLHVVLGMLDRLNAAEAGEFKVKHAARATPIRHKAPLDATPEIDQAVQGDNEAALPQVNTGPAEQQQEGGGGSEEGQQQQKRADDKGVNENPSRDKDASNAELCSSPIEEGVAGNDGEQDGESTPPKAQPAGDSSGGGPQAAAVTPPPELVPTQPVGTTPVVDADCISIVGTPAGAACGGSDAVDAATKDAPAADASPMFALTGRKGGAVDLFGDEGEGDEDLNQRRIVEQSFDMVKRVRRECANPAMVHFCSWLLQGYASNSPFTNHALTSFLARIADPAGINLEAMMYQLSVLRVFYTIISDGSLRKKPEYARLIHFATRTVRNMLQRLVPDLSALEAQLKAAEAAIASNNQVDDSAAQEDGLEEGSTRLSAREAADKKRRLELEMKVRKEIAALGFLELLFWKGMGPAEAVQNEYNWRKIAEPPATRKREKRRRVGDAGDSSGEDSDRALVGFASAARSKKGVFDEERMDQLRTAFGKCNGQKDCLDLLVHEFGGMFKKVLISRQLKALGLAKGKFTAAQEETLKALYLEHSVALDCFDLIAEEVGAGFTASQVKRQLKKMGVIAPKGKRGGSGKGKHVTSWAALGDSDDDDEGKAISRSSDDQANPAGGNASPELGGAGGFDSSSSDSDKDDSGFESAKSELESSDSEEEGVSGAAMQRLSNALGEKNRFRKPPQVGSIEFGAFSHDSDIELALGVDGKNARALSPSGGESPLPAAVAAAPEHKRLRKAGGGGTRQPGSKRKGRDEASSDSDSEGAASGGSFVTLQDSLRTDAELAGGAELADTATQELLPAAINLNAATAAGVGAAPVTFKRLSKKLQQGPREPQPEAPQQAARGFKKHSPEGQSSDVHVERSDFVALQDTDSDSKTSAGGDGFYSAGEDDPVEGPSSSPERMKEQQQAMQKAKLPKRKDASPGAAVAGKENACVQVPNKKRKGTETAAARTDNPQRAAALEALRRKRLEWPAGEGQEGAATDLPPATEPLEDWPATEAALDTKAPPAQQETKPAGRRLLKKAGGAAVIPAPLLDDLDDF